MANDYELTEEEIQWVKSTRRLSPEMREFIKEQGGAEEIGKAAPVHAKIAAAAKAEAEALFSVRQRRIARGDASSESNWRTRAIEAESREKDKDHIIRELERQKLLAIAQNLMAVNSED